MAIPLREALAVGRHIITQKLRGNRRYPLVLMLEPLFRCNLECIGCGKIQFPEETLRQMLTPEQCFAAAEECGAPVVSIAGGEPLIHPQIREIVEGLIARGKFIYLCSNALLLMRKLDLFAPGAHLTLNVHLDGPEPHHDQCVSREGTYKTAVAAIREAKRRRFRVTTNTTMFNGLAPEELHLFFDAMVELGIDGMMISPGYSYEKAPVQDRFLRPEQTTRLFRRILEPMHRKKWPFNHSPFYLDFLMGERGYDCTPWGSPNYSLFGWQRPCYLFSEGGYARTFKELIEGTEWERYGHASGHPKCSDCMMHCGFEPSAVNDSMASAANIWRAVRTAMR